MTLITQKNIVERNHSRNLVNFAKIGKVSIHVSINCSDLYVTIVTFDLKSILYTVPRTDIQEQTYDITIAEIPTETRGRGAYL